tara:strand:- start:156 stop:554 length:399 start_codon:yes stop_codon:yes gene_type:complete
VVAEEVPVMQEALVVVLETGVVLLALEHKAIPVVVLDTVMMVVTTVLCMVVAVEDQMLLVAKVALMTEREGLVNCSPLLLHMEQTPLMQHRQVATVATLLVAEVVVLEKVKQEMWVVLEVAEQVALLILIIL